MRENRILLIVAAVAVISIFLMVSVVAGFSDIVGFAIGEHECGNNICEPLEKRFNSCPLDCLPEFFDTDGDGYPDSVELNFGTDPNDPEDYPTPRDDEQTVSITKSVEDECRDGYILDEADTSYITGDYVCKPTVVEMTASNDFDDYLTDYISGTEVLWDDWMTYEPLVEQVESLTDGLETDQEKVEAIANWVYTSKQYACDEFPPPAGDTCIEDGSPANNDASFIEIWESEVGVCLDAAVVTTAMFRVAGVPAIEKMEGITHIVTLYNVDDTWYIIDTTYCSEEDVEECAPLEFLSAEEVDDTIYFLSNRIGHFETDDGEYCENDFCLETAFTTNKIMPLNKEGDSATVYYPSATYFYVDGTQLVCSLEFRGLSCDASNGCQISLTFGSTWNTDLLVAFGLSDMRNIGYNEIILPSTIDDEDYIDEWGEEMRYYRFACKEQTDYRLIAYTEFTLEPDQELLITYANLVEGEDALEGEFDQVVAYLKETTEDLGIVAEYN